MKREHTPHCGTLHELEFRKRGLWLIIKQKRNKLADEPLNGDRYGLRLDLLRLRSEHSDCTLKIIQCKRAIRQWRLVGATTTPLTDEQLDAIEADLKARKVQPHHKREHVGLSDAV